MAKKRLQSRNNEVKENSTQNRNLSLETPDPAPPEIKSRKPIKTLKCFVSSSFSSRLDRLGELLNTQVSKKVFDATSGDISFKHSYRIKWVRLDQAPFSRQTIHQNVSVAMRASHFCIADVTSEYKHDDADRKHKTRCPSPSVMHEIGFAHGLDVPVFLIGENGSHRELPANLEGSLVSQYEKQVLEANGEGVSNHEAEVKRFTDHLASTIVQHVKDVNSPRPPGEYHVEGFRQRRRVDLPYMMRNARYRIYILTTNLDYIVQKLLGSIEYAIVRNKEVADSPNFDDYDDEFATPGNPSFKVDIQTMDPESVVTNARAKQINVDVASYRDSLRSSLEKMRSFATEHKTHVGIEVGVYVTLPTLILFVVDDTVVFSAPFPSTQSRLTPHFVIENDDVAVQQFISYFFSVKSQATQQTLM